MGNRAVIQFGDSPDATGIYLHWNGGEESVNAFLRAAKALQIRDDDYGVARLCQIIGNFFGGTLSLGCGPVSSLDTDNGDNGTFVIHNWTVIRRYGRGSQRRIAHDKAREDAIFDDVMRINAPIFKEDIATRVEVTRVPREEETPA